MSYGLICLNVTMNPLSLASSCLVTTTLLPQIGGSPLKSEGNSATAVHMGQIQYNSTWVCVLTEMFSLRHSQTGAFT